ncbi:MAG: hypothetical protein ACE5M4_10130, partial [Anaerolineales bacterium]
IWWLPNARVLHHGGQSSKQIPVESFLNLYRGKITYFRKHKGAASADAYKFILALASLGRLFVSPLAWLEEQDNRERHLALADRYKKLLLSLAHM